MSPHFSHKRNGTGTRGARASAGNTVQIRSVLARVCILLLGLGASLALTTFLTPTKTGFYCGDRSIRYPYKSATIKSVIAGGVALAMVLVTVIILESVRLFYFEANVYTHNVLKPSVTLFCCSIHPIICRLCYFLGSYVYGAVITNGVKDLAKFIVGSPRPYFLAVCQPDWTKINCTIWDPELGTHIPNYISDNFCSNKNRTLITDAKLSWPSGHAALAFYTTAFLCLYLHYRTKDLGRNILVPMVQLIACLLSCVCASYRVKDHHHHVNDVIAGAILGIAMALWTCLLVEHFQKLPSWIRKWSVQKKRGQPLVGNGGLNCFQDVVINTANHV